MILSKGRTILLDAAAAHRESAQRITLKSNDIKSRNDSYAEIRCSNRIMDLYVKKYISHPKGLL